VSFGWRANLQAKVAHRSGAAAKVRRHASRTSFDSCTLLRQKCCVYVLRSLSYPPRYYTGVTSHAHARLAAHNAGKCPHTADKRPWQIDVLVQFTDEQRALAFERYLKSGSGCAFAKRHLR
jgi:predicted GIY-YIG superfamily endonuclease